MTDATELKRPEKKSVPVLNVPPVVIIVIGVLFAIHAVLQWKGVLWQVSAQFAFAFIPMRFTYSLFPQLKGSAYWSMFTYGLLHADWAHLGFNSLWLLIFSKPVALRLGSLRYLLLLTLSVFFGAVAGLIVHWGEYVIMVGISAGVSGVMAAAIPIMYARGGMRGMAVNDNLQHIKPLTPVQIFTQRTPLLFALLWIGLTMFTATSQYMTGVAFLGERVVAWEAHLGGFLAGFFLFYLLDRKLVSPPPHL